MYVCKDIYFSVKYVFCVKPWYRFSWFKGIFDYAILCPWHCEHFDIAHLALMNGMTNP